MSIRSMCWFGSKAVMLEIDPLKSLGVQFILNDLIDFIHPSSEICDSRIVVF